MSTSLDQYLIDLKTHINECNSFIESNDLEGLIQIDHLCYKCSDSVEYSKLRQKFELPSFSRFLHQAFISKRRVSYFALLNPIEVNANHSIPYLELADKKPDTTEASGFHHAEIYPKNLNYKELIDILGSKGLAPELIQRPHHTTHDIRWGNGFIIRITDQPLIRKILIESCEAG